MTQISESVSIIIPVYNEGESLRELHKQLDEAVASLGGPIEFVFVNDGSQDGSEAILAEVAKHDDRTTVVNFRRNFGQTAALMAGIDHSTGQVIVPIDADLQNDPADIPRLLEQIDAGFDVVSGWRRKRQDAKLTRTIPSRMANWLISWISGVKLHDYGCSLKAYRREVIEDVRLYGEMHRFIPIYARMQGGRIAEIEVNHRPRRFGSSHYNLSRIYKVLLDLIFVKFLASYSAKPIYLFGGFGLTCLLLSSLPVLGSIFFKVMPERTGLHKDFVETPLPVLAAVLVLIGFLALLQGILAEMLMRTYFESQQKRTYVVRQVIAKHRTDPLSGER